MNKPPISKLAIAALVSAFLFRPIGLILGLFSLYWLFRWRGEIRGLGLSIAAILVAGMASLAFGFLPAAVQDKMVTLQCRSKQSEAKVSLKRLHDAELQYDGENGRYFGMEEIPDGGGAGKRYAIQYIATENSGSRTFLAEIQTIDPSLNNDTWTIDHMGTLTNTVDGCLESSVQRAGD